MKNNLILYIVLIVYVHSVECYVYCRNTGPCPDIGQYCNRVQAERCKRNDNTIGNNFCAIQLYSDWVNADCSAMNCGTSLSGACYPVYYTTSGGSAQYKLTCQTVCDNVVSCTNKPGDNYYYTTKGENLANDCQYAICTACSSGFYKANCGGSNAGSCTPCIACVLGKYQTAACSDFANIQCTDCTCPTAGQYKTGCTGTNAGTCVSCSSCPNANEYRAECAGVSPGTCQVCGPGYYITNPGQPTCTACDHGKYSTGVGMTDISACVSCSTGMWSSKGSSACSGCMPLSASSITNNLGTIFSDIDGFHVQQIKTGFTHTFSYDIIGDVLLIGGGGNGGTNCGGGGGAGAVVFFQDYLFKKNTPYTFAVGAGGAKRTSSSSSRQNGFDTTISTSQETIFRAKGGGFGSDLSTCINTQTGNDGGSGGGGGGCTTNTNTWVSGGNAQIENILSGTNAFVRGSAGGKSFNFNAGGGGGAGTVGIQPDAAVPRYGTGGNGVCDVVYNDNKILLSTLFGSAFTSISHFINGNYYVGGGGSGAFKSSGNTLINGGYGGGGNAYYTDSASSPPTAGMSFTGGGGGGGSCGTTGNANTLGEAGGSGIILIRYRTCQPCSAGTKLINPGSGGSCTACEAGKYSALGASTCVTCPANSIPDSLMASRCANIPGTIVSYAQSNVIGFRSPHKVCAAGSCGSSQSSTFVWGTTYSANLASDGISSTVSHTNQESNPSWTMNLERSWDIIGGKIQHRTDCCQNRNDGFKVWVGNSLPYSSPGSVNCYTHTGTAHQTYPFQTIFTCKASGSMLTIHLPKTEYLSIAEIEIYASNNIVIRNSQIINFNSLPRDSFQGLDGKLLITHNPFINPLYISIKNPSADVLFQNNYALNILPDGNFKIPWLWYKFDNPNCLQNSGTASGMALTANAGASCNAVGYINNAGILDSTNNQYFILPNNIDLPSIQVSTGFTISLLFKAAASNTFYQRIIGIHSRRTTGQVYCHFEVQIVQNSASSNPILVLNYIVGASSSHWVTLDKTFNDNDWHFLAIRSETGGLLKVYIDGEETKSLSAPMVQKTAGDVEYNFIGRTHDGDITDSNAGIKANGLIDDFRLYKELLTLAEIREIFLGAIREINEIYTPCSPGTYTSSSWATTCTTCPLYTTSLSGASQCISSAGYYISTPGATGIQCTANNYCPQGATAPVPCPDNTACGVGQSSATACLPLAGYYQISAGTVGKPCEPDYYCLGGSNARQSCPANTESPAQSTAINACTAKAGFYGTAGSAAIACPPNTYSTAGSTLMTHCNANAGYYGAAGTTPTACPPSKYCPPAATSPLSCPNNTDSPMLSHLIVNCTANAGYFGNAGNTPTECYAGFYCIKNSVIPAKCPNKTDSLAKAIARESCFVIPGYYGLVDKEILPCPNDFFCPAASITPYACPKNTVSPQLSTNATACLAIAGYFGAAGYEVSVCTPGYYCIGGNLVRQACPTNTDSPLQSTKLTDCVAMAGYYGAYGATATQCSPNRYCPPGATAMIPCPVNTTAGAGKSSISDCLSNNGMYQRAVGSPAIACPSTGACPTYEATVSGAAACLGTPNLMSSSLNLPISTGFFDISQSRYIGFSNAEIYWGLQPKVHVSVIEGVGTIIAQDIGPSISTAQTRVLWTCSDTHMLQGTFFNQTSGQIQQCPEDSYCP